MLILFFNIRLVILFIFNLKGLHLQAISSNCSGVDGYQGFRGRIT